MKPSWLRRVAFACAATTAAFSLCFFAAKHRPALVRVAPFVDDPYDAVGSFAVQLAAVAAALSLLRALRGHVVDRVPDAPASRIVRGIVIAMLAFFVTVIADIVAMIRHPDVWLPSEAGRHLTIVLGILGLSTAGGVAMLLRAARIAAPSLPPPAWGRAAAITGGGALVLALYPEAWRHGVSGAILTATFGTVLLFFEVWSLALALVPPAQVYDEDLLDDLHAVLEHVRPASSKSRGSGAADQPPGRTLSRLLRAHPWPCVGLIALACGFALALSEVFGEGLPGTTRGAFLVFGVFTGIEAMGVVLGYALFRRLLGLRRPG